ncbi:MAG: hypothetical protein AAGI07_09910 [Bacteroidota bacterium]
MYLQQLRVFISLSVIILLYGCKKEVELPTYTITGKVLNELDDRIFGGFFEKATWNGEIGSDAAISLETKDVFPEVKEYMDWMQIPILRFPGGTAIDYYPWYNLIDNMPEKHTSRPRNLHYKDLSRKDVLSSDGRMGLHEYIKLCKELAIEPHLVVNLGDAFYKKLSIEVAAQELAADLVSYCNDESGKWAELRSTNGDEAPFNVKYFQIGNETWLFEGFKKNQRTPESLAHYTNCVEAYARAMKEVDPSIELIIDGVQEISKEVMQRCGDLIAYNTFHTYSPWGIKEIKKNDEVISIDSVTESEVWQGLASAPLIDENTGLSIIKEQLLNTMSSPLAITEWNLNCWFQGDAKSAKPYNQLLAYGIGAGSYLHAIMRVSDKVKIANQSMLVGTGWLITGIRVDTTEQARPQMYPTGLVTGLYSRNHGNELMEVNDANIHMYNQPLVLSNIKPAQKVAEQDVVVTKDGNHYYVHIVNRSFDKDREVQVVFPEEVEGEYTHFLLSDRTKGEMSDFANIEEIQLNGASRKTQLSIPSKSVSVFKFNSQGAISSKIEETNNL